MNKRTALAVAATVALVAAAAAGAAGTGLLHLTVGSAKPSATGGITVHGKWTLLVRSKSGKVVARRHFENSLTPDGAKALANILVGGTAYYLGGYGGFFMGVVGGQAVQLDDGSTLGHGCNLLFNINPCFVWHTNGDASAGTGFESDSALAQARRGAGPLNTSVSNTGTLTLTGSAAPLAATTVTKVETLLKVCGVHYEALETQEYDPNACANENDSSNEEWVAFTSKTLANPLPVQAGQSVSFTVQLSFS